MGEKSDMIYNEMEVLETLSYKKAKLTIKWYEQLIEETNDLNKKVFYGNLIMGLKELPRKILEGSRRQLIK